MGAAPKNGGGLRRGPARRLGGSRRVAEAALVVLAALLLACVLEPWLSTYRYDRADLALGPTPPSWAHWMGTDQHGRDLMARIFFGGRVSLAVGLVATAASLVIGVTWGAVAGWLGGHVDAVMMRVVDGLYAFPFLVLVIAVMVFLGGERAAPFRAYRAALNVLVAHPDDPAWPPLFQILLVLTVLGAVSWLTMARIVRALVLSLREQLFVEAARALGAGSGAILRRHVLPNAIGPIVVYAALTVPEVMMTEAFLSFLGLGAMEPLSSWGQLAGVGAGVIDLYPWLLVFPALALVLTLVCFTLLGDGLIDAVDPQNRRA